MSVVNRVARVRSRVRVCRALGVGLAAGGLALQVPIISCAQTVTYQVNPNGQVAQATYPNGTVVKYAYDGNGNRVSATATPDTTPPSSPGSVTDSSVTSNSVVIDWTAATDSIAITGYAYSVDGGSYTSFASYPNGLDVGLPSLTPGSTYTIAVEAEDAAGNISSPTSTTVTLPPSTPGTPIATNVTATSATVSWTAASSSAGITGYAYQLNGGAWSSFSSALSANLPGLTYGTAYTIGVEAKDGNGNLSAVSTGTFTTGPTAPGVPTASSITGTSATVSWTAASDSLGVTGYSYQVNGGTWSAYSNTVPISLTGLNYGTTYTVGVRAEDNAGNLSAIATGSFTTLPSVPGTPTASNITGTTATVSWTAATDANGVSGYRYQLNAGTWSSWTSTPTANLTGLSYGTAYTVGVEAEDALGNVGPIATGTFATPPSTPGVPAISNITGTSATANWSAATDGSGITGYSYQLNGGSWFGWSSATTASLTGLAYGTSYTVGVRAEDANNNIGATSTASFTTAPSAPGTPTFSSIGPTSATVSWAAASSAVGIAAYRYSTNGGSTWTGVGTALAANLSGLSLGTAYTVLVEAETSSGAWGASSSGTFTTLAYYTDTFAMTAGSAVTYTAGYGGVQIPKTITCGFPVTGSTLSPTTTTTGLTLILFEGTDNYSSGLLSEGFTVSGFTSNPGAGWLQSIVLSGVGTTLTGASATFSYSGGVANWNWTSGWQAACGTGTLTAVHK